jgi:hypothetical protein
MKKITILLALLLSFTFSFGQKVYEITHAQLGTYNKTYNKWVWGETEPTELELTLNESVVTINNKSMTTLLTYEYIGQEDDIDEDGDSYRVDKWYAYDQEKRKCVFVMMNYKNIKMTVYQIKYSDYIFRYYAKRN